jgi:uncharacterized protein (DUF433 family)
VTYLVFLSEVPFLTLPIVDRLPSRYEAVLPLTLAARPFLSLLGHTSGVYCGCPYLRDHMPLVIDQKDLDRLPITIDPEIVSGSPVFRGTRVPVEALISNLEDGLSLDEFLNNFPTVTREQAVQVLEFSKSTLLKLRKSA